MASYIYINLLLFFFYVCMYVYIYIYVCVCAIPPLSAYVNDLLFFLLSFKLAESLFEFFI
jgi:hypothetical protein